MKRTRSLSLRGGKGKRRRSVDASAYQVGYGKPPEHSQFKKGRSGNLQGRPPGRRNLKTVIREVLEERVQIRQGGRIRKVPYAEALIRKLIADALQGNSKAITMMIALMRDRDA